jgi:putative tryptophan/tyrosine transport system substrate-binding protein
MSRHRMKRRQFLSLVGATAVAWPLAAPAQPSGKIWRVGFIAHRYERFYDALFEGLRELGYVEGQNIIYERRYAEGHAERFAEFAREMVALKADVIVVVTTPAAQAVAKVTSTIPIVHPAIIDPLATGLIESLAHPGRNLTGGSSLFAELTAKQLELLKQIIPRLSRTAVLWDSANKGNVSRIDRRRFRPAPSMSRCNLTRYEMQRTLMSLSLRSPKSGPTDSSSSRIS